MAVTSICPACDETVVLNAQPKLDEKVQCPHCRTDLVVVEVNPVELDWDNFEDDWDDDENWDDEEDW